MNWRERRELKKSLRRSYKRQVMHGLEPEYDSFLTMWEQEEVLAIRILRALGKWDELVEEERAFQEKEITYCSVWGAPYPVGNRIARRFLNHVDLAVESLDREEERRKAKAQRAYDKETISLVQEKYGDKV